MLKKQLPSWQPRSFQETGVELMIKQACAGLLWKPGRGKTTVFYMAFRILQDAKFVNKALVICPIRPAYRVWPHQCHDWAEFDHLRVGVLHGPQKDKVLASDDYDLYVINPEGLDWLFKPDTKGKPDAARMKMLQEKFQVLLVDESTKFKNPQTRRFKVLRHAIPKFKRRYILTGSFRAKSLMDLFGQVYILDEGASLGRYITHFRTEFFYPSGYGGYDWTAQPGAIDRVIEKIAPLCHVMNSEEGLGLPELVFNDIYVDLPPQARRAYDQMEDLLMAEVASGQVVAANAAVASAKCRQIANGIVMHPGDEYDEVHEEKLNALKDLMEQLGGAPVMITYEYTADRDRIIDTVGAVNISSGNARKDDDNIAKFSRGELEAVIGHPQSIALGIDGLQKHCADIIMFGTTWSLELYEQVIQRVRRSGNKADTVTVHRILARNTIDERVIKVLDNRDAEQKDFLELLKEKSDEFNS